MGCTMHAPDRIYLQQEDSGLDSEWSTAPCAKDDNLATRVQELEMQLAAANERRECPGLGKRILGFLKGGKKDGN